MSEENQNMVLTAVLDFKDRLSAKIKSVNTSLNQAKTSTEKVDMSVKGIQKSMEAAGKSALSMKGGVDSARSSLQGLKGDYKANVSVKGNATGKVKEIKNSLAGIQGKAYTATVNIRENGLAKVKGSLSNMASGMMMGMPMQVAGLAGAGYGIVDTIKTFREYEYQMATVKAVTGATASEFERLDKIAKHLGETTVFKASEVGKAEEYMGFAGWKTPEIEKALPSVLDLAVAAGEELKSVSDIVTDAMTGFGLKATDEIMTVDGKVVNATKHFSDIMAALATNANTTVGLAGESAKYAGAVVGAMYSSQSAQDKMNAFKDWAVVEGLMANAGIKGSMAGTAQRAMLTRLASLQQNADMARQALGVDFVYEQSGYDKEGLYHEKGQTRRMRDIIGDIRHKFNGMGTEDIMGAAEMLSGKQITKQQRKKLGALIESVKANGGKMTDKDKATMTTLLSGQEALAGWLSVFLAKEEDNNKLTEAIDKADGAASRIAKTKQETLDGDIKALGSAWEAMQLELMNGKGGEGLRGFFQGVTADIRAFKKSLEDGFDIGDVGGLALNVLTQLKDKFLQLDGVGSILAGGALAFGLKKLYDLSQKVYGGLKRMTGGKAPIPGGSLPAGAGVETVSTMNVNATTVYVNGKTVNTGKGKGTAGGGNTTVVGGDSAGGGAKAGKAGKWARFGGAAKMGGLALAFSGLEIYSNNSLANDRRDEAQTRLTMVLNEFNNHKKDVGSDEYNESLKEYLDAQKYVRDVDTLNQTTMAETYGGAAGAAIGAAIGSFAGPFGTIAGGILGDIVGRKIGEAVGGIRNPMEGYNENSSFAKDVLRQMNGQEAPKPVFFDQSGKSVEYTFGLSNAQNAETQAHVDTFGINTDLSQSKLHVGYDIIKEETDAARAAVEETNAAIDASCELTGNNIRLDATNTAQSVTGDFQTAANDTQSAWFDTAGNLQTGVYSPMQTGANQTSASMTADFSASAADTQSSWSGVGGFFSSLWAELEAGAASCAASMSQTLANAAASLRANGHTTLASAADWAGNNLAWLGGTDYPHHASGTSWAPGGFTEVNEHGGEIIDLPNGSRVYPHATTVKMLKNEIKKNPPLSPDQAGTNFTGTGESEDTMLTSLNPKLMTLPPMTANVLPRMAGNLPDLQANASRAISNVRKAVQIDAIPRMAERLPKLQAEVMPFIAKELPQMSLKAIAKIANVLPEKIQAGIIPNMEIPALPPIISDVIPQMAKALPTMQVDAMPTIAKDLLTMKADVIPQMAKALPTMQVDAAVNNLDSVANASGFVDDTPADSDIIPADISLPTQGNQFGEIIDRLKNMLPAQQQEKKDAGNVTITGNTFEVREEADIDKIAYKLCELITGAQANYNPI